MTARDPIVEQPGQPLDVFGPTKKPTQPLTQGLGSRNLQPTPNAAPEVNIDAVLQAAYALTKSPYIYRLMRVKSEMPRIG